MNIAPEYAGYSTGIENKDTNSHAQGKTNQAPHSSGVQVQDQSYNLECKQEASIQKGQLVAEPEDSVKFVAQTGCGESELGYNKPGSQVTQSSPDLSKDESNSSLEIFICEKCGSISVSETLVYNHILSEHGGRLASFADEDGTSRAQVLRCFCQSLLRRILVSPCYRTSLSGQLEPVYLVSRS